MKKYFKFESSNYVNYEIRKIPKLGTQSVLLGSTVNPSKLPPLAYEHNFPSGEPLPHFLTGGTVLASKKLLELLDSIGVDNYQAFPASLLNLKTNEKRDDYFLFNVIGFLQAADLGQSSYDELMSGDSEGVDMQLVAFTELTIDGSKTHDLDMFRLAEEPVSIIVSERIVDALKSNKPSEGWGIVVEYVNVV